ncbi:MAG: MoaD/ThiS family protein [Gemmatimonadaceae bacterium]|nr:MoaD/ThiS family protein [Gemmatimonadaceae bacterium]
MSDAPARAAECIRVVLPSPLRALAGAASEVRVSLAAPANVHAVVDALEAMYPMLRGTIRDRSTRQRRAFVRFYACARDWSHQDLAEPLPEAVRRGDEPLLIVGAMAGG